MEDKGDNVVQLQTELVTPPARTLENVPDDVLLYMHDALTYENNIFIPKRYDTEAGRKYCVEFYRSLRLEIEIRDINTETGTRMIYTTLDLLPR